MALGNVANSNSQYMVVIIIEDLLCGVINDERFGYV